ncbi:MAG: site-specific DNA-methyltransferase, partial [Chloroflexota bacterium]
MPDDTVHYADLLPQTPDLNGERLQTLKRLFPDLFTLEGALNPDELRKLVDPASVSEIERYEFRWFGKSKAKRQAFTPTDTTLAFDPKRSVNPAEARNVIIEGENLEALKLLTSAYREQIKCIYIDPPYNTGNDFVYRDDFSQNKLDYLQQAGYVQEGVTLDTNSESNGRYHSNWLNMMYSRLLVARALLKPDGVIFVSIDDNEAHHLRKLLDEVFGEENFLADIIWEKRYTRSNDAKLFASVIDHIIVFRKSASTAFLREPRTEKSNAIYSNPDNDERGDWTSVSYVSQRTKEQRPNLSYKVTNPFTGEEIEHPTNAWKYSKEQHQRHVEEKRLFWGGSGGHKFPRLKQFLSELGEGLVPINLWGYEDSGSIDEGTKEVDQLLGKDVFDYPKPTRLITRILQLATLPNETHIVLDFFAGSGTTGQAVMELNEEDGGNRSFILVQFSEATSGDSEARKAGYKKISDITIERNKRVIDRMAKARETEQPALIESDAPKQALGFKVFRLEPSNFTRIEWAPDPSANDEQNVASLRAYIAAKEGSLLLPIDADSTLREILLKKEGFSLNAVWRKDDAFTENKVFLAEDGERRARVCVDSEIKYATAETLK